MGSGWESLGALTSSSSHLCGRYSRAWQGASDAMAIWGGWEGNLNQAVREAGASSLCDYLAARPLATFEQIAYDLGGNTIAPVQVRKLAAKECPVRDLDSLVEGSLFRLLKKEMPTGWYGKSPATMAVSSLMSMFRDSAESAQAYVRCIDELLPVRGFAPPGWQPEGPDDPLLEDLLSRHVDVVRKLPSRIASGRLADYRRYRQPTIRRPAGQHAVRHDPRTAVHRAAERRNPPCVTAGRSSSWSPLIAPSVVAFSDSRAGDKRRVPSARQGRRRPAYRSAPRLMHCVDHDRSGQKLPPPEGEDPNCCRIVGDTDVVPPFGSTVWAESGPSTGKDPQHIGGGMLVEGGRGTGWVGALRMQRQGGQGTVRRR